MEDERQMSGEEIINPGADENPSGQNPNGQNPENGSNYYGSVAPFNVHSAVSSYGADDCLDNFPPGYRFKPHDDELVVHYLRKKILNLPLPPNRITEVKLYNSNPKALAEAHKSQGDKEWYFFTPRDRKYKNGERPNRAAGGGYWKATGADKPVKHKGVDVGSRKALVFYEGKPPKGDKTDWIMHEFRMDNPPKKKRGIGEEMRLDDWVLCRLYKKLDKSNKGSARPKDTSVPNEAPGNEIPSEFQDREHVQLADFKMSPQENFMPDGLESFDQICGFYNSPNQMCWNPFDNASYLHGSQGSFPGVSQSFYPQLGQNAMASMIPGYHNPSPMIGEPFPPSECHIKNEKFNDYHSDDLFNIPPEANSLDQIVSNFRGAPCSVCPPSFDDASGASKPVMTPPPRDDKKLKRVKKHQ